MRRMNDSSEMRWTVGALGLLLTLAGACGDDGDGKGGSSGVSSTKPAADVTDDEAMRLCMWFEEQSAGFQPTDKEACTLVGQSFGTTPAECDAFVTQCLAQPDEGPVPDDEDDGCEDATAQDIGGASCTATVGEIEACLRDSIAQQKGAFRDASCANAGKVEEPASPASCTKLQTTCPGLFEGGGDDGGDNGDSDDGTGGDFDDSTGGDFDDSTGGGTGGGEFTCDGGLVTYSAADECDGIPDCEDGADEAGC